LGQKGGGRIGPLRSAVAGSGQNEERLWLSIIAYNLGNLWPRLVLPKRIDTWSPTRLQQRG
jgi:hypothetical protein